MGNSGRWLVIAAVALGLAGAWQYRDRLKARLQPAAPAVSAQPMAQPDVLYSWVDKDGVTHYEQQSGRGQRVEFDGSRITPLAPVDAGLAERVRQAAGPDTAAASEAAGGETAGAAPGAAPGQAGAAGTPPTGAAAGTLEGLRHELQVKAQKIRQSRAAERDF